MKITCSKGTGMQLEEALENALYGVDSATNTSNIPGNPMPIEAGNDFQGGYPDDKYLKQLGELIIQRLVEDYGVSGTPQAEYGELEIQIDDINGNGSDVITITAEEIDTQSDPIEDQAAYYATEIAGELRLA